MVAVSIAELLQIILNYLFKLLTFYNKHLYSVRDTRRKYLKGKLFSNRVLGVLVIIIVMITNYYCTRRKWLQGIPRIRLWRLVSRTRSAKLERNFRNYRQWQPILTELKIYSSFLLLFPLIFYFHSFLVTSHPFCELNLK